MSKVQNTLTSPDGSRSHNPGSKEENRAIDRISLMKWKIVFNSGICRPWWLIGVTAGSMGNLRQTPILWTKRDERIYDVRSSI